MKQLLIKKLTAKEQVNIFGGEWLYIWRSKHLMIVKEYINTLMALTSD